MPCLGEEPITSYFRPLGASGKRKGKPRQPAPSSSTAKRKHQVELDSPPHVPAKKAKSSLAGKGKERAILSDLWEDNSGVTASLRKASRSDLAPPAPGGKSFTTRKSSVSPPGVFRANMGDAAVSMSTPTFMTRTQIRTPPPTNSPKAGFPTNPVTPKPPHVLHKAAPVCLPTPISLDRHNRQRSSRSRTRPTTEGVDTPTRLCNESATVSRGEGGQSKAGCAPDDRVALVPSSQSQLMNMEAHCDKPFAQSTGNSSSRMKDSMFTFKVPPLPRTFHSTDHTLLSLASANVVSVDFEAATVNQEHCILSSQSQMPAAPASPRKWSHFSVAMIEEEVDLRSFGFIPSSQSQEKEISSSMHGSQLFLDGTATPSASNPAVLIQSRSSSDASASSVNQCSEGRELNGASIDQRPPSLEFQDGIVLPLVTTSKAPFDDDSATESESEDEGFPYRNKMRSPKKSPHYQRFRDLSTQNSASQENLLPLNDSMEPQSMPDSFPGEVKDFRGMFGDESYPDDFPMSLK